MTFKIGDRLVYPNYGVGVVETVQESLLGGSPAPWYELRFLGNNSRVMVPVGNSDRIGLRLAQINGLPESEVATKVEKALDRAITNRHPVALAFGNQPGPPIPASTP